MTTTRTPDNRPVEAATSTLTAQCSNCASWRMTTGTGGHASTEGFGYCQRGLFAAPGALFCPKYEVSHSFKQQIISTMLTEHGPMAMPVKLIGGRKSARQFKRRK